MLRDPMKTHEEAGRIPFIKDRNPYGKGVSTCLFDMINFQHASDDLNLEEGLVFKIFGLKVSDH